MADALDKVVNESLKTENQPAIIGLVSSESMKLSREPADNAGEIHTLNQLEVDLVTNPFVAEALQSHLDAVTEAVQVRVGNLKETPESAWNWVVGSAAGAGPLTETSSDYLVAEGHGRKETLVSISALPDSYPTTVVGKPNYFSGFNSPAVWPLGREVFHNGKGNIFITEQAFKMVKNIHLRAAGLVQ